MFRRMKKKRKEDDFYFDRKDYECLLRDTRRRGLSIAEARMVVWLMRNGKLSVEDVQRIANAEPNKFIKSIIERGVKKLKK